MEIFIRNTFKNNGKAKDFYFLPIIALGIYNTLDIHGTYIYVGWFNILIALKIKGLGI